MSTPATFEFLVFSLRSQAEMNMGLYGFGGEADGFEPNLEMARHAIDLLGVIQEKTKGNLTLEEDRLLSNSLTELRFRFVQASDQARQQAQTGPQGEPESGAKEPPLIMTPGGTESGRAADHHSLKITVLGSGTSSGVPMIGCQCEVCGSSDPRDNRLRPSISIEHQGRVFIVDTTPDFRYQALRARLPRVDGIVFTHSHADHIMGLDDVRPFNFHQGGRIPLYGAADTISTVRQVFHYIFDAQAKASFVPQLDTYIHGGLPFELAGLEFQPIRVLHGKLGIYGYRFGDVAYLTDHSNIPEESMEQLRGLDILFLDALRHAPHPTHSTVETSLETVSKLGPNRAFLTHMSHDLPHAETDGSLPRGVHLAYDGLVLNAG